MTAVSGLSAAELEGHFAGMPRRALWPSGPGTPAEALEAFGASPGGGSRRRSARTTAEPAAAADAGVGAVTTDDAPGLWAADDGSSSDAAPVAGSAGPPAATNPTELLARGRADLRAGDPTVMAAGLDRLALALRLDPTLAPVVLEALGRHREPEPSCCAVTPTGSSAAILEAEAAYCRGGAALDVEHARRPSLMAAS